MKRSGRISLILLVAVALVGGLVFLFLQAGESPTGVAGRFMTALAKQDRKTLTELTYMDGLTKDQIDKKWEETLSYGKHYYFYFWIKSASTPDATSASVRVDMARNANVANSYEEKYELPLIRRDNKWLVDVRGIHRELYPGLPR